MNDEREARGRQEMLSAFVSITPEDNQAWKEFGNRYGSLFHGDTPSDSLMWSERFRSAWLAKTPSDFDRVSRYIEEVFNTDFPLGFASPGKDRIIVNFEKHEMTWRPRCLLDELARTLLRSEHLGICRNPQCSGTKYFVAVTYKQKFCGYACSQSARKQTKRDWWAENGDEWRKDRQQTTRTKKGKKTR